MGKLLVLAVIITLFAISSCKKVCPAKNGTTKTPRTTIPYARKTTAATRTTSTAITTEMSTEETETTTDQVSTTEMTTEEPETTTAEETTTEMTTEETETTTAEETTTEMTTDEPETTTAEETTTEMTTEEPETTTAEETTTEMTTEEPETTTAEETTTEMTTEEPETTTAEETTTEMTTEEPETTTAEETTTEMTTEEPETTTAEETTTEMTTEEPETTTAEETTTEMTTEEPETTTAEETTTEMTTEEPETTTAEETTTEMTTEEPETTTTEETTTEITTEEPETTTAEETTTEVTTTTDPPTCPENETVEAFTNLLVKLSSKYLRVLIRDNEKGTTLVGTVLGILRLLGLSACYTYGHSYDELLRALQLKNCDQARCMLDYMNQYFTSDPNSMDPLLINYVFGNTQNPFTPLFKEEMQTIQFGEAVNVNFNNSLSAINKMNKLIEKASGGEVPSLFTSTDEVNKKTLLVAGSVSIFQPYYDYGFDRKDTTKCSFQVKGSKTVEKECNYLRGVFPYIDIRNIGQFVLLPAGNLTVIMILPDKNDKLPSTINKLTVEVLNSVQANAQDTVLSIMIPKIGEISTPVDDKRMIDKVVPFVNYLFKPKLSKIVNAVIGNKDVAFNIVAGQSIFKPIYSAPAPKKPGKSSLQGKSLLFTKPFAFYVMADGKILQFGAYLR